MQLVFRFCMCSMVAFAAVPQHSMAQPAVNAVIAGDFADPSIIRKGNLYYAVGTSSEWAPHFPIYVSGNRTDWKQTGYVFDKAPSWTAGSFWAPEYYFHNNTYFIYYTARRKTDNVSCIGVATSAYPDKGFTDHGVIVAYGKEAIDAFVFEDEGRLYITFKAYGLDERPIEILGSALSEDGLQLAGSIFSLFKDEQRIGLEGQSIRKHDGYYYLFYAAGNCCGINCDYNVRVARSRRLEGPYEQYPVNPVLQENKEWKCSGHGTFVNAPNGKVYYLHHAYNKVSGVFTGRQALHAELTWPQKNSWPVFKEITAHDARHGISDAFATSASTSWWQWDFKNAVPVTKQSSGHFYLSGSFDTANKTGIVVAVRPAALAFTASTTVANHNDAVKGLAYYGDVSAATGIGMLGDSVIVWVVKDGTRNIRASKYLPGLTKVDLKIQTQPDSSCHFFYKKPDATNWIELTTGHAINAGFLPQWDRSPRIGLHIKGSPADTAVFSSFQLNY
ncbi:MAG: glycoside hydrolase family 43 protein [Chitinophagaceae bacterium]